MEGNQDDDYVVWSMDLRIWGGGGGGGGLF